MPQTPPAAPRNRVLVALDVIAGIVVIVFGLVLALAVIANATLYAGVAGDPVLLGIGVYGIIGVAIIVTFLGVGFFVVALIRKRLAFVWPLGAFIIVLVAFYAGTWLVGQAVAA
ncbi:MAG TPA: hypothetical protein VN200_10135 [Rhodoglobus sp.]|nr:hypothetical protein [Rhodoglobus sp.]